MDWLEHPRYRGVRDSVIQRFKSKEQYFRKLQYVLFLCGGAGSHIRDRLADYLRKKRTDTLVFYADDAWLHIAKHMSPSTRVNALDMERDFAELADIVVIVVESPGTFAELGAFSLSEPLRKKLLPILDAKYKGAESFINTGPVRWVDADSFFAPSIFADFGSILTAAGELDARIERLAPQKKEKVPDITKSRKHLLFFICDLVGVIGPATYLQVQFYIQQILGPATGLGLENLLGLGVALKLIKVANIGPSVSEAYYYPAPNRTMSPFTRRKFFDVAAERAKVLSVLQTIESAAEALALVTS